MQLALMLLGGALLSVAAVTRVHADDVINTVDMDTYDDDRAKRPFCNAFTGCGRKRSGPAPLPVSRPLRSDDPMATLFDLNSEPAVAELSRQILSEAKLWEAIKEASRDEGRRRHSLEPQQAQPLPRRLAALRSFRRRRSSAPAGAPVDKLAVDDQDQDQQRAAAAYSPRGE